MLIHLLQPYAMTYISRHRELLYKKVLLNISEYFSQTFLFFYNFDKKEALSQVVFDVKIQKTNVCKCFLRKCLYFLCIYCRFSCVENWELLEYNVMKKYRRSLACLHSQARNRVPTYYRVYD